MVGSDLFGDKMVVLVEPLNDRLNLGIGHAGATNGEKETRMFGRVERDSRGIECLPIVVVS